MTRRSLEVRPNRLHCRQWSPPRPQRKQETSFTGCTVESGFDKTADASKPSLWLFLRCFRQYPLRRRQHLHLRRRKPAEIGQRPELSLRRRGPPRLQVEWQALVVTIS